MPFSSPPRDARLYRWRFGSVEFDEARHELRVAGLAVDIEHKPLEVLSLLLRHVGEVVTKEELFDSVWAGRITVDHVLATAVGKLRKALDAAGESRIATVPRIGYRFDGPVERTAVGRQPGSVLKLEIGQPVPGREHFLLERPLGSTLGSEVWLARQPRSRETRVFKFALDGERLSSIKREATLLRVLRDTLGERDDFVRALDWNFESEPYFLECEYGGEALPEWAAKDARLAALPREPRIAFFLQIADAVAAAHGVGVLHKDLKPANILVAAHGGDWQVRLTDFGNSRLLQPERLAELGITALGLTAPRTDGDTSGTPLYLAPELVAGQPPTMRSDVYALGVMLYQCLVSDLRRPLAPGWEREIDDPLLREDIAQATDGDPARRIASAAGLAERLRHLPQRRTERTRREAQERAAAELRQALERTRARRPWVAAAVSALCIGLLLSGLLWGHSERQRRIAQQQVARTEAVVRFLDHALGTISTGNSGHGNNATIREMLEYASAPGNGYLSDDPEVRGDIHTLLGRSWRNLGDSARGVVEYRTAVGGYAQALGESHELTLKARYALARTLAYMQTAQAFAEAGALLDETDRLAGARLQQDNALALQAALERGIFHLRRLQMEPALHALRRADRLQRKIAPDDAGTAALIRGNIADALRRSGKPEETLAWLRAAQADPLLFPERIGEVSVALLQSASANALHDLGRHAEALPLARAAAEESRKFLGPDDYLTLVQLSTVASIHGASGNCSAALPLARDVRERMARRFGENMQATLIETGNLGKIELDCGERDAGIEHLSRAEDRLRADFGEDNVAAHNFRYALARALAEQDRYREALAMAEGLDVEALTAGDPAPGWEHRLRALRGRILMLSGDAPAGRELLAEALPALVSLGTEEPDDIGQLRRLLDGGEAAAGP
ncbi:protein kinase domain-containing protein [Pseudoxanthomonas putridarboris]|uniref:Winged helix-turn-helix domain-containing protein n=1 Tax=Pseudoxanthomonas putridarboris TaxID=752605 RepID=A0ABU9IXE1_9GAMM